ncbi:hypothetical protein HZF10_06150 [Flavobacterium sp. MAH-1]|uniref:Glycosyltransferase, catalytic subunit of cellulose synthase and poly-beta-1,6-N-acetylglucosamine synthase n=1 Tax=Flavobacterium agri TaxID=2743471 RepID=A0A7Y8Y0S6_9FLAO|nr:glycosyltransferase family 2 protein [Flavobacterium agri]NYA70496.1 hypothetical protein [Flavobacterium agri]
MNLYILDAIRWLKHKPKRPYSEDKAVLSNLYIIIPVLDEMALVESAVDYFVDLADKYPENKPRICFVTTAREYLMNGSDHNTVTLLEQKIASQDLPVLHFHYHRDGGFMADQIRFALEQIKKKESVDFLVGIYNVDSRPGELEFSKIRDLQQPHERYVLQQYAFYENRRLSGRYSLLSEACLWQTRWSLGFELGRVRHNQRLKGFFKNLPDTLFLRGLRFVLQKFNYTIGHGIFFNSRILEDQHPYPIHFQNEDAYWGYELALRQIEIHPLQTLETAHFTSCIRTYIKQQAVWFNGPLSAFNYYFYYFGRHKKPLSRSFVGLLTSLKLFMHAVYWIFSPYAVLFLLPFLLYHNRLGIVAVCIYIVSLVAYLWIPNKIIAYHFPERKLPKSSFFLGLVFYLLHTFGPLVCCWKLVYVKKEDRKSKTKKMAYEY